MMSDSSGDGLSDLDDIDNLDMIMQQVQAEQEQEEENGVRPDATGLPGFSVIMKCTSVIRQLASGVTPDSLDEDLQMALIVCTGNEEIDQKHGMGNLVEPGTCLLEDYYKSGCGVWRPFDLWTLR
nr:hypothetical protein [Tanacetum cinerariifolium]